MGSYIHFFFFFFFRNMGSYILRINVCIFILFFDKNQCLYLGS